MPTNNPKVSGYVPKTVYDCLIKFQEERSISISQAVTIVLSEYFGVNQGTNQPLPAGVTLAQLQELEQRIQELEHKIKLVDLPSNLLVNQSEPNSELEESSFKSEPASSLKTDASEVVRALEQEDSNVQTSLNTGLLCELQFQRVEDNEATSREVSPEKLAPELQQQSTDNDVPSEPANQKFEEGLDENEELAFSVVPLSAMELSERLKVDRSAISRYKNGSRKQSLSEWSKTLDPDGVAWEYSKERKKYIPSTYGEPEINLLSGLN